MQILRSIGRTSLLFPLSCALLATLGPDADAGTKEKIKKAKSELGQFATVERKAFRKTNDLSRKEFELTIELLGLQVELGSVTPDQAAMAATEALAHALAGLEERAVVTRDALESFAAGQIDKLGLVPKAYCLGAFGTWDDIVDDLTSEVERADGRLEKALRAFGKEYAALAPKKALLLRRVPAQAPEPVAPGPGGPDVVQSPVRIHALAASSETSADDDGFACVRGKADPTANGGELTVRLYDGGAVDVTQIVLVGADGSFVACFPSAGPPNLAEGNYRVIVRQGGAESQAGISVP